MGKVRRTWDEKVCTGTFHWSECTDWRIYKYESIFDIPVSVLEAYGWNQLEFGVTIEIPIQKYESDPSYSSRGGFNHGVFQILKIDWQYLLERQAYQFASLYWEGETIELFFTQFGEWMKERASFYKEIEIKKKAQEIAKQTGMNADDIIKILKAEDPTHKETGSVFNVEEAPKQEIITKSLPVGVLEKLGNEFFIHTLSDNLRYKVGDKRLIPGDDPTKEVGKEFEFTFSTENPPKSRNAKGWVLSLVQVK